MVVFQSGTSVEFVAQRHLMEPHRHLQSQARNDRRPSRGRQAGHYFGPCHPLELSLDPDEHLGCLGSLGFLGCLGLEDLPRSHPLSPLSPLSPDSPDSQVPFLTQHPLHSPGRFLRPSIQQLPQALLNLSMVTPSSDVALPSLPWVGRLRILVVNGFLACPLAKIHWNLQYLSPNPNRGYHGYRGVHSSHPCPNHTHSYLGSPSDWVTLLSMMD
mmetsp:Transcript_73197/g.161580  ORF Transcript_73197/g.161580 Transcript_73197/m.161580 type:complete len:214 (+) Transcript_73197:794-1435(+)